MPAIGKIVEIKSTGERGVVIGYINGKVRVQILQGVK